MVISQAGKIDAVCHSLVSVPLLNGTKSVTIPFGLTSLIWISLTSTWALPLPIPVLRVVGKVGLGP